MSQRRDSAQRGGPSKRYLSSIQRDFAARVNHTLRGDINALRQALEQARARLVAGGAGDPLAQVERAIVRVERRALDIALLTQADAGTLSQDLRRQPTRLGALVNETLQATQSMADLYAVELVADLDGYDEVDASLDRALITRALGALLDNAIRATPEGGRVVVSAELTGMASDMARLSVRDQGPGFTAGAERLLVPFAVGNGGGRLGLGLAVAQAISAAHGGYIQVASGAEGATVTIEIELT